MPKAVDDNDEGEKYDGAGMAAKPVAPAKSGKLRSINIRCLENGYIGSASFEPPESKGKDTCCYPYVPDKEYALADRAAIDKFIGDILELKKEA